MNKEQEKIAYIYERLHGAAAVIWDMDGVLIDSEHNHDEAHRQALREAGVTISRDFYIQHGISTDPWKFYSEAFASIGRQLTSEEFQKIRDRKKNIYQEFQKKGINPNKPALNVLGKMYSQGMKLAIVSQVERWEITETLLNLGIAELFAQTVASDDFKLLNKKPAPDLYLKAAELLGVDPNQCLAIEDSATGAAAAIAANMTCLIVPNDFTRTHQFPNAGIITTFSMIDSAI